ncbi:MAG: CRISPR-associated protein Cas4 [Oscillospiraceae bacterium]|nr:CRISPR-associated protein Cas4 [Oscillospiraceae bacterium]
MQHFLFCRRQWALIHIENLWAENLRTTDGNLMHERTHNESLSEKRGDGIITRGMSIFSRTLGISGKCDVLEFHRDGGGVPINGWDGRWLPFPVEYKRGEPKQGNCDTAQLCAQAMCLEEMLCCKIPGGALFYGETRRRLPVEFTAELRSAVTDALTEMHELYQRGSTPKGRPTKSCNACSMKELCLPALLKRRSVTEYMEESL